MSKVVMLKRAFNQAVATGAVRFTDKDTDFLVIKNYMIDYAKKYGVEVSVSEIEAFIKRQQESLIAVSTKITGEGHNVEIENISVTNQPEHLTKDEILEDAFNDAVSNAAVLFTDKVADFLVIRNSMLEYTKNHGQNFTLEEIESYIRRQEKLWDEFITDVEVSGNHINALHVSSAYEPEELSDEELLKEAFLSAAANPAVKFVDENIDFLVIKSAMEEFIKAQHREIPEEKIVARIKESFHKMNEAAKDFSHEFNAMK